MDGYHTGQIPEVGQHAMTGATLFSIKEIPAADLLASYKPEEIQGCCSNCNNHGNVWSCPPHRFDPAEFIRGFAHAYIISASVSMVGFETQTNATIHYYEMRQRINRAVREFEAEAPSSTALYAGHCDACKPCTRIQGDDCIQPELCRYSLESLGLDVAELIEIHFGESLQWVAGKPPEKLLCVPAILSQEKINQNALFQSLEDVVGE